MGNAWFVSPLTRDFVHQWPANRIEGAIPDADGIAPTPTQVFAAVATFPEYRVISKRRDRGAKGESIDISMRHDDGSCGVSISLLGARGDDRPVEVFAFDYYKERDELVKIVATLAESCGPLVLWHDGGDDNAVVVAPAR